MYKNLSKTSTSGRELQTQFLTRGFSGAPRKKSEKSPFRIREMKSVCTFFFFWLGLGSTLFHQIQDTKCLTPPRSTKKEKKIVN